MKQVTRHMIITILASITIIVAAITAIIRLTIIVENYLPQHHQFMFNMIIWYAVFMSTQQVGRSVYNILERERLK